MKHRHPNKRVAWIASKYLKKKDLTNTRFGASFKDKDGKQIPIFIRYTRDTSIRRHIKIRSNTNPYNPVFKEYLKYRESTSKTRMTNGCKAIRFVQELSGQVKLAL